MSTGCESRQHRALNLIQQQRWNPTVEISLNMTFNRALKNIRAHTILNRSIAVAYLRQAYAVSMLRDRVRQPRTSSCMGDN